MSDLDGLDEDDMPPLENAKWKKKRSKNKNKNARKRKRVRAPGLLPLLSNACMAATRAVAASRLVLLVYDNINLMNRVAEQILGRKSRSQSCSLS